jgi:hypothetical protein
MPSAKGDQPNAPISHSSSLTLSSLCRTFLSPFQGLLMLGIQAHSVQPPQIRGKYLGIKQTLE